jgi:iduronate 2-sulfatase
VRGDHWRYTRYGDGSEELFHHAVDANEWENLAGDAGAAGEQAAMKRVFELLTGGQVPDEASGQV